MLINNFLNHIFLINKEYKPNVIMDIGSRDLGQSIEFNSVFPDAKIYAFEPNPEQAKICKDLSADYDNIFVEEKAVSDENGVLDFYVTHGNVGASSLLEPINVPFASTQDYTKISVPVIRLDDWMRENNVDVVDIMWLDTQGIELKALKSMGDALKKVKFIHCEAADKAYYKGHLLKNEL
jgi:FkbM family methyltransferase